MSKLSLLGAAYDCDEKRTMLQHRTNMAMIEGLRIEIT